MHDTDYFDQWDASEDEFNEILNRNPSLRGMVKGYMAEEKLKSVLSQHPNVKNLESPEDHNRDKKGDWRFDWNGEEVIVEVKCLQSGRIEKQENGWRGTYQCDASDCRAVDLPNGDCVETTLLKRGEFDILAIGIFDFDEEWDFIFARNDDLPSTNYNNYTDQQKEELIKGTHFFQYPLEDDSIYTEDIWSLL